MNILIVTYYFSPKLTAHAYRWTQIAQYFAQKGHNVEIITSRANGLARETMSSDMIINRIGFLSHQESHSHKTVKIGMFSKAKKYFLNSIRKIYRFFYWPDGLWHWLPYVLFKLYKFRHKKYDVVISYSPTFSSHVAALFFKKVSTSKFKWIADYGDPFSTSESMPPNNFKLYKRLNKYIERRVINEATPVFTSEATILDYERYLNVNITKKSLIPHHVDLNIFYAGSVDRVLDEKINIVYIGGFHKNIREPYIMIEFFKKMIERCDIDIEINIYGPDNGFNLKELSTPFLYHGPIKRECAITVMKSSDFLINVQNQNCSMIPSKVVECIATGRPVINFGCKSDGDFFAYEESGAVFNISNEFLDADIDELIEFIIEKRGRVVDEKLLHKILYKNSIENIAAQYLELSH